MPEVKMTITIDPMEYNEVLRTLAAKHIQDHINQFHEFNPDGSLEYMKAWVDEHKGEWS